MPIGIDFHNGRNYIWQVWIGIHQESVAFPLWHWMDHLMCWTWIVVEKTGRWPLISKRRLAAVAVFFGSGLRSQHCTDFISLHQWNACRSRPSSDHCLLSLGVLVTMDSRFRRAWHDTTMVHLKLVVLLIDFYDLLRFDLWILNLHP